MTSQEIKQIIDQEEENIKALEEKQQQFQELIDKAKLNIATAKSLAVESKNPYERVEEGEKYYRLRVNHGKIINEKVDEDNDEADGIYFENGLYFNDEAFAEKTAKEVELKLKLKKFTYENGWSDEIWEDGNSKKYFINKDVCEKIMVFDTFTNKIPNVVYFKSREIGEQAIENFRDLLEEVL